MKLVFVGSIGRAFYLRNLNNRSLVEKKDYVFVDEDKELNCIKETDSNIPQENFILSWNQNGSKITINLFLGNCQKNHSAIQIHRLSVLQDIDNNISIQQNLHTSRSSMASSQVVS